MEVENCPNFAFWIPTSNTSSERVKKIKQLLKGKKILIGVTGSIAAYKSTFLVREFIKAGAEVKVIMTPASIEFITPLTLATLSKNPVHSDFTEDRNSGEWVNHVDLGLWADVMIIAPITANTLSKIATGNCDNFLLAVYLSARCPVFLAPAMDLDMFSHGSTADNLKLVSERGDLIIEPNSGELASGLDGKGRMAEPEEIRLFVEKFILENSPLHGKTILITAGPTYEKIDPVRFIGNHSSGKMGYALAQVFADQGAQVHLISGPSHQKIVHPLVSLTRVVSAQEMYDATHEKFGQCDVMIASAAVADYKPSHPVDQKIKKKAEEFEIQLEKTQDILKSLGEIKTTQFLVGFALETENGLKNAEDKLKKKNLDMIVLNSLKDKGAGFGHDTNKISILESNNKLTNFELKSKTEVAQDIVDKVKDLIL